MCVKCLLMGAFHAFAFCVYAEGPWDASMSEFQRLDGEVDDSPRIQRAIDASPSGVVYFPRGEYRVASPIVVTNFCSLQLHKSAVLRATAEIEYVLKVNGAGVLKDKSRRPITDYNAFVTGGCIDGNGLASCMSLDGFWHYTMRDTTFLNGKRHGLRLHGEAGGYELIANNLYFKCTMPGLAGNIALESTGGDSHFTDCVVVDYTIGFKVAGGNRLTRCHVWGGPIPAAKPGEDREMLKDSICYWIAGQDKTCLRDCYADTGKTGFLIDGNAQLLGCWYFNNTTFNLDGITVVDHRKGILAVSDGWFIRGWPTSKVSNAIVYRKASPELQSDWENMTYQGFAEDNLPGVK